MKQSTKVIFQTLCYSDIFDCPLTAREIWTYSQKKIKLSVLLKELSAVPHSIVEHSLYYALPKRESIISAYIKKQPHNRKKMLIARNAARMLSYIPTIAFIGISGSLASKSAKENSDIDLFFVTYPHTIWITRFLVYLMLEFLGLRRKRNKHVAKDTICANMFVDKSHLRLPLSKRSLFSAREIVQIVPLVDRNQTCQAFLQANSWIGTYFPNLSIKQVQSSRGFSFWKLFAPLEFVARQIQLWYMKDRKTRETITASLIAFHPIDYEKIILTEFEKKKQQYGV